MTEAVIFDLDGTLLDSEILWVEAVQQALRHKGAEFSDEQAMNLVYGRGWREIYLAVQAAYPDAYSSDEDLQRATRANFDRLQSERDIRIPSSVALLETLARQFPVAVVSGSTRAMVADGIALLDIESSLEFYLGAEDYARGKPAPDSFLEGARRLGVRPESCLVFEDSAAGVQAAKQAGMTCVALQRPDRPAQEVSAADEVLQDLKTFSLERYL